MRPRKHLIWTRHRDQKSIFSPRKKDVLILPEQDFADLDFIFALSLCQSSFPKTQNFELKKNVPMKTEYIFKLFFTKNQSIASVKRCFDPRICNLRCSVNCRLLLREAPMLLECRKSNRVRSSSFDVCPEVIENTRAAYRGWTHAFPYAGFDHLIFQDFKKSKKGPSCFSFKT